MMNKFLLKTLCFLVLSITLVGCDDEDADNSGSANITLDGTWNLTMLNSTPAYDLDMDGTASTDLMNETTCFDNVNIIFSSNGTFTAINAEIDLDAANNITCSDDTETGTWSLSGNSLSITVNVNGGTATQTRAVNLTPTEFSYNVTAQEAAQFFTIPVGSSFGQISNLQFVYTKM